jgi:molybdate transport system substrate-binding protein
MKMQPAGIARVLLLAGAFSLLLPPPGDAQVQPVQVYCAAGVTEALEAIGAAFTRSTGTEVKITRGGSAALSREILRGAPADIFVPEGGGVLLPLLNVAIVNEGSSFLFATNSLVVVAPVRRARTLSSPQQMAEKRYRRLSLPDTDLVPSGILAKRSLINLDLWDRLQDRIHTSREVQSAVAVVESEEADLGMFYVTDVRKSPRLKVVLAMPPSSYDPISYSIALVAHPGASPAARPFLQFLRGPEARQALLDSGLTPASP